MSKQTAIADLYWIGKGFLDKVEQGLRNAQEAGWTVVPDADYPIYHLWDQDTGKAYAFNKRSGFMRNLGTLDMLGFYDLAYQRY